MPMIRKITTIFLSHIKKAMNDFIVADEKKCNDASLFYNHAFSQYQRDLAQQLLVEIDTCPCDKTVKSVLERYQAVLKESMLEIYDHIDGLKPRPAFDDGGPVMLCSGHVLGYETREKLLQTLTDGSTGTILYKLICAFIKADHIVIDSKDPQSIYQASNLHW